MVNFGQIVINVGERVGDTSSAFASTIKKYVNYRYHELWERFNWGTLNPSYTFNITSGTADYKMPTDFWKSIYVYDNTSLRDIAECTLQDLERRYVGSLSDTGNPQWVAFYNKIHTDVGGSDPDTGKLEIWARFYPTPSGTFSILMPYQLDPGDLSADTDLPVIDCSYEVELGATADAWRTKRQFAKAADFDSQFEQHIQHMIWRRENDPNRITQFSPNTLRDYNRDCIY